MSCDSVAISARDITKHYLLFERPEDRLKQSIVPRLQRLAGRRPSQYYRNFTALNGVSFDVRRGETVGIIGRNGCGKSTLLQIICGTLLPSTGTVDVKGRIAALLELGAGFNPEFTGRENVYMNGAILGLSRAEIAERFDAIAAFADIGDFIEQPVKTYSSGMYVRLAFATAINADPDILVIDEALAVGDEAFQRKCYARIQDIRDKGATILFVSHGAQTVVQLCDRAMLIDAGELLLEGRPKTVVNQYQRLINLSGAEAKSLRETIRAMDGWAETVGTGEATEHSVNSSEPGTAPSIASACVIAANPPDLDAKDESWFDPSLMSQSGIEYGGAAVRIRDVSMRNSSNKIVNNIQGRQRYVCEFYVDFDQTVNHVGFGMGILSKTGFSFGGANTYEDPKAWLQSVTKGTCIRVQIAFVCTLMPGTYMLNCGVRSASEETGLYVSRIIDALMFRVNQDETRIWGGHIDFQPEISIFEQEASTCR